MLLLSSLSNWRSTYKITSYNNCFSFTIKFFTKTETWKYKRTTINTNEGLGAISLVPRKKRISLHNTLLCNVSKTVPVVDTFIMSSLNSSHKFRSFLHNNNKGSHRSSYNTYYRIANRASPGGNFYTDEGARSRRLEI